MPRRKVWWSWVWSTCSVLFFLYLTGLHQYLWATSYARHYVHWGPTHSLQALIHQIRNGEAPDIQPVNEFLHSYTYLCAEKCQAKEPIRLMYVVKSAIGNFNKRMGIRKSWGFERRFSDVEMRTVFLVGTNPSVSDIQLQLEKEIHEYSDIIQANFIDAYANNSVKTMMGLHWTYHYCQNVKYFLFVDDDYYVSTRNVLSFLRDPVNYPHYLEKYVVSAVNEYRENLYAGYVFDGASPIRWFFNKWYISLEEYPYSQWPPYVTGGAYVLSRHSLEELYFGALYTSRFRFDDVFLGMAAKKAGLKPFHHKEFYFYHKSYDKEGYKWVIASHGYDDPEELQQIWNEQKSAGNA